MASIFDSLYRWAIIVLIIFIAIFLIGMGVYLYYLNYKKKRHKNIDNINYAKLNRADTKDYIKVNDIIDNVVRVDNGYRFVGVIECQGYNFYYADIAEQANTIENYLAFVNTITKPITYRQFSKSVDMENYIVMYKEAYTKICEKLESAIKKLIEIQRCLENEQVMAKEKKEFYELEMDKSSKEVKAYNFRKYHLETEIAYIQSYSGVTAAPIISSTYVFDWEYNPLLFQVDLSENEIFERAKAELDSLTNSAIHALSMSGVKAKRCGYEDLIDMFRRHSSPISAERYKQSDVVRSSYFDDINTTDNIDKIKETAREETESEAAAALAESFMLFKDISSVENDVSSQLLISNEGSKGEYIDV